MIERLLVVLAILVTTLLLAALIRAHVARRMAAAIGTLAPAALRPRLSRVQPTVVYFYGPHCGTCAEQARALDELVQETRATVVSVDTTQEREIADSLGVVTIPSTAVLDAMGRVRQLNLGYHPKGFLALQLAEL